MQKGFTLVEVMIVIAIISLLAIATMASYVGSLKKANDTSNITRVKEIQKSLELYFSARKQYPGNLNAPTFNHADYFTAATVPKDRKTNQNFPYSSDTTQFCLCTNQLERQEGGNANVTNIGTINATCNGVTYVQNGAYFCVQNVQ